MSERRTLIERFKPSSKEKIAALVGRSRRLQGKQPIFGLDHSTRFSVDKEQIGALLRSYQTEEGVVTFEADLQELCHLTGEVKAICAQALLLHGERVQKAQHLMERYREGAFTAWLVAAYGNRQTPYNFLNYYELYQALPAHIRPQLEQLPRQVVYTLGSRDIEVDKKIAFISAFRGETKEQLLDQIRTQFPLAPADRRRVNRGNRVCRLLQEGLRICTEAAPPLTVNERTRIEKLLNKIRQSLD